MDERTSICFLYAEIMMLTATTETAVAGAPQLQNRKLWTVDECERMMTAGIDLEPYQLIDGELIVKIPKGDKHNDLVSLLAELLRTIFGRLRVREEKTIKIPDVTNWPEPDIAVVNRDPNGTNPTASEILLVVEVSDTTLRDDLGRKAFNYAKAGIPEYWVLNVEGRCFVVHRDPDVKFGNYKQVISCAEAEPIHPLSAPEAQIKLTEILLP
jgi:Uma2 family endonuclease